MGWVNAALATLDDSSGGWDDYTIVQRIEAEGRLRGGGTQIRVTFRAGIAAGFITNAYIGHAADSGNDYDFETTPTQLFFGDSPASATVLIAAGEAEVTIPVDFALSETKPLLISFYTNNADRTFAFTEAAPDGWEYFFKAANDAATVDKSGYTSPGANRSTHIEKVEIFFERVTWPDDILPECPLEAFTIDPDPALIRTPTESGLAKQRRMFGRTVGRFQTVWSMTGAQLAFFKSWYEHKAGAGSVWFLITLLVDALHREYDVRFVEPPTYYFVRQEVDGEVLWRVEFMLEAIMPPPLTAGALDVLINIGIEDLQALADALVPPVTLQPAFDNWLDFFPA